MAQLQQQRHNGAQPEKCRCHSLLWEIDAHQAREGLRVLDTAGILSDQSDQLSLEVALIYLLVPEGGSGEGTHVLLGTLPLALAVQLHSGTKRERATALRRKHARRLA